MKLVDTLMVAEQGTANLGEGIKTLNDDISTMDADPAVKLQEALANMKTALEPILTKVAEMITVFATWASENPVLLATITAITTILGILMGIFAALAPVVSLIINNFALIRTAFLALTGPIGLAIAAITGAIAIGVALYKNWDEIKEGASKLAKTISNKFQEFKKAVTDKMNESLLAVKEVWQKVMNFFTGIDIKGTGQKIFATFINGIGSKIADTVSKAKELWKGVQDYLKGINIFNIGKDIISGLIRGMGSMANEAIKSITGIVDGIVNKAKSLLKIKSPSRVFMEIGEFTNEGFINGLEKTSSDIEKTMNDVYGNLGTNTKRMVENNVPSVPTTNNNVTNSMPINISLNYSGNASEADAMRMVDIIETQLGNRLNSRLRMSGVRS